ncbi:MAG TPA: type II toxin-antitoxin system RelE/ParE family toxin [Polyangia bacterium]|jgi:Plasmid stabilisation system protein.|nr:type II toxin-antitoxin system RelE/ParE family toxin [Polyangia bacterium]
MRRAREFRVVWTGPAAADLERIALFLLGESPLRAGPIVDRIVDRAESLTKFPSRGRTPPELRSIGDHTWREIQESPWRIIYRVGASVVQVHAVLDGRRSLEDILMERILHA